MSRRGAGRGSGKRRGLCWRPERAPRELHGALRCLAEAYPVAVGRGPGTPLEFERAPEPGLCETRRGGDGSIRIRYGAPAQALRAVGAALAGLDEARERSPFTSLGIMLDCSRNAVMTVEHLRVWLRRLALLGCNQIMLYTEDTYELPGEPWFGWQRGRYTARELRELDACATRLGIELVPCIQTLGHLEKVLRHGVYAPIRDTPRVLMVGEPKTYELIAKMIAFWKGVCRSDRIHIGMDEAEELGRGRYLTLKGYRPGFELMSEHLERVVAICGRHGLRPMIWSDMYFRLGSKTHAYYDREALIPPEAARRIPRAVDLVYWDYYHEEPEFYRDFIERHRRLGKEPIMASGIWTWNRYWYHHAKTVKAAGACLEACRQAGVRELFFTQWGDNGAYCDHDSAFAGMAWCAERAYGGERAGAAALERRFAAVCGGSYRDHLLAAELHRESEGFQPDMWDDPIFETHVRRHSGDAPRRIAARAAFYDRLARRLQARRRERATGDFAWAYAAARAFADRYAFAAAALAAYRRRDRAALRAAAARVALVRRRVAAMAAAFRRMWMSRNKPEGIETIQGRFGMLDARYRELALRLRELAGGRTPRIPEWDAPCPPRR